VEVIQERQTQERQTQERQAIHREIGTAVRHSLVYGLGSMAGKGLGFLMVPFYTHYLSPGDYGVLEILDLSISLLGMFLNMGITAALLRSHAAAKSPEQKRRTVSTAFLFVVATAAVTLVLSLLLVRPTSHLLLGPGVPSKYLMLSLTSFIFGYVINLPRTYLLALEASKAVVLVDTVALSLILLLNIYFIAVLKIGLTGILMSALVVGGLQLVVLSVWMLRRVGIGFSGALMHEMVGFGLPLILSNLAMFTLNFSDRFFLQHLRSLEIVGIYSVGYKFGFMMNYLLVQPFFVMWQSRMYLVHKQPDHAKVFGQIFVLYSVLLTYGALGLAVLSPEIIRIMVDVRFTSSAAVIPIVAAAYVFYGLGFYAQLGMFLKGKTRLVGGVSAAAAALNLALNYVLVLHYGMLGAAWATLIGFAAIAVGGYWLSQRVFRLPLAIDRVGRVLILGVGFYLLAYLWTPASLALTLLIKTVLLLVFPLVLWKARVFSTAEIETLAAAKDSIQATMSKWLGIGKAVSE
jgi:O-antigen/teichoic acid export membrane protein